MVQESWLEKATDYHNRKLWDFDETIKFISALTEEPASLSDSTLYNTCYLLQIQFQNIDIIE